MVKIPSCWLLQEFHHDWQPDGRARKGQALALP